MCHVRACSTKAAIDIMQALSDAHTYLFEERDRLLKLQSEHDELRLQEVEDRKRIRHLLAMHGPMEQEITYNRDGKPNTVTVYPRRGQENNAKRGNQADASERVMRTVYLPAANADNLMLKVESLQAQLNEQVRNSLLPITCVSHNQHQQWQHLQQKWRDLRLSSLSVKVP